MRGPLFDWQRRKGRRDWKFTLSLRVPRASPISSSVFHAASALSVPRQRRAGAFVSSTNAPLFFPSFLWKEVPRRGGGWPRETVLPHSGKPTPPRFARLPLPEEGARMIFKETLIKSLSFAVRDSRFPTCAAHLSDFLICLSYR